VEKLPTQSKFSEEVMFGVNKRFGKKVRNVMSCINFANCNGKIFNLVLEMMHLMLICFLHGLC